MNTTPVIKRKREFSYKTIRTAQYEARKLLEEANKKLRHFVRL